MLGDSRHSDYLAPEASQTGSPGSLRIMTHYSAINIPDSSPTRPSNLGLRLNGASSSCVDLKSSQMSMRNYVSNGQSQQSWTIKLSESQDFEKMLGHIGNNGSTPVTPTSFLNPKEISADQERFADQFTKQLDRLKNERERRRLSTDEEGALTDATTKGAREFSGAIKLSPSSPTPINKLDSSVEAGGAANATNSVSVNASTGVSEDLPDGTVLLSVRDPLHLTTVSSASCENSDNSITLLYNLLPPQQQQPSPLGSGSPSSGAAVLSNSSASSTSPNLGGGQQQQRYNCQPVLDVLLPPFSRPSFSLPPLRGTNSNCTRQQHQHQDLLSIVTSEHQQQQQDYALSAADLRRCIPHISNDDSASPHHLITASTAVQLINQASELCDVISQAGGEAVSLADITLHGHVTTTDGLLHILNAGDQNVLSSDGSQHGSRGLNARQLSTANVIGYGVLDDPSAFATGSSILDRQGLRLQQQQPVNSDFLSAQHQHQQHQILMGQQQPQHLNGLGGYSPVSQQQQQLNSSQSADKCCNRKRGISNTGGAANDLSKKRNRRRHEPTIAAAQAIVNAAASSGAAVSAHVSDMGLSQQQQPCSGDMMDHLSLTTLGGANPGGATNTITAAAGGRLAPNLVGGLKMDEFPSRSFETDIEDSSNRSSSVPPCGDAQDPTDPNKLKVERKRARNRLAARRCRERKVSLINSLENKVAEQNNYVKRLESELERYRNETNQLRLQLEQLAESFPNLREDLLKLPPPISTTVGSAVPQKLPHLTSFEKLEPPQ
uniref:BZIP domain-containing protein n=1 Tax=Schistocephalus solidus TaxID=70667 RepID=A0A0X3NM28_SCHSO